MEISVLSMTDSPIRTICFAARTCYDSREKYEDSNAEDFIRSLIRRGHESPLEHASVTFDIRGISRACANQLTRHRVASFCQESLRYVRKPDTGLDDVVIPDAIRNDPAALEEFGKAVLLVSNIYNSLLSRGIRPEDARGILPLAFKTNITMTMNFREIRHFLRLRLSPKAQSEIRTLAFGIVDEIRKAGLSVLIEDLVGNA